MYHSGASQRCLTQSFPVDDVVMKLLLRRDVIPPYHDVETTFQKRRRLKDVYTTSLNIVVKAML